MSTSSVVSALRTPVLIVGAGPAGLIAAIRLRVQGIDVRIVDEQLESEKRTYPVLLHPRTLRILESLGVSAPLEWRGRAVTHLAVHVDGQRRTVLDLPGAGTLAPGALTLPQDVLRGALMHRLAALGVHVEWQTRLTTLAQDATRVRSELVRRERPASTAHDGAWVDAPASTVDAEFVIGADGTRSTVRQLLGIAWLSHGGREIYAFYDAPDARSGAEAHLVLTPDSLSSVYPLQGELSRFTFQLGVGAPEAPGLIPLQQLLSARLPWYASAPADFEWSGRAEFYPALAKHFGEGRAWLVGDAAHSTGPLGGQSLNVGIHEANDLALRIGDVIGRPGVPSFGAHYTEQRRVEWQRLFGVQPNSFLASEAADWVNANLTRLLPALPASGDDLDDLLDQLGVRMA